VLAKKKQKTTTTTRKTKTKEVFYPEPHLWLIWRWGLMHYLPGLASNHDPPNLSPSSS
jgi:hypothetical protein